MKIKKAEVCCFFSLLLFAEKARPKASKAEEIFSLELSKSDKNKFSKLFSNLGAPYEKPLMGKS